MVDGMKRVHYGNLTIDVSDNVADAVLELAQAAASRHHINLEENEGPAFGLRSIPSPHGTTEQAEFSGYINGTNELSRVALLLGTGFPIAVSTIDSPLEAPALSAEDESALRFQIEEFDTDRGDTN